MGTGYAGMGCDGVEFFAERMMGDTLCEQRVRTITMCILSAK